MQHSILLDLGHSMDSADYSSSGRQPVARIRGGPTPAFCPTAEVYPLLIIRESAHLRALLSTRAILSPGSVVLELPGLSAEAARAAAERIVGYSNECGCSLSAKCMVAGFALAVAWLALRYGALTTNFLWRLPLGLLCAFAGAGIGKSIGVVRARARLKSEIAKLIADQTKRPT